MENWEYEDENIVLFWGGILSNWHKSNFVVRNVQYNCAEQFMMAQKAYCFGDNEVRAQIMKESNPRNQKALGRTIKKFNSKIWLNECRDYVFDGIKAKFLQNDALSKALTSTESKIIAEASPHDMIWGIGLHFSDPAAKDISKWRGKNFLGDVLMKVRDELVGN